MATTHTASVKVSIFSQLSNAGDLDSGVSTTSYAFLKNFTAGTGADQSDQFWSDTRSTSGTDSLDLSGALTNKFGESITLTKVKLIMVKASASNTTDIEVTRPASNGLVFMKTASDALLLKPGGIFLYVAPDASGVAVTAGTGDLLDIVAASGTTAYDIAIIGIE